MPMDDEQTRIEHATAWAVINGLVMALPGESQSKVTHCPFTLQPTPYPRRLFETAVDLSKPLNALVDAVSRDVDFLVDVHKEVVEVDGFTRRLVDILQTVTAEGVAQPKCLGICRQDYMIHTGGSKDPADWQLHQVEINTIASSFGALSSKSGQLHRYLAERFGLYPHESIPESKSGVMIPGAICKAFELNNTIPAAIKKDQGCVLFIVQTGERNIADQKALEMQIWEQSRLRVIRRSLREVEEGGQLDADRHLVVDGHVVVVAYYRAGYTPDDYQEDESKCWAGRLKVERSTAIKCPNIGYHLAGTKKVQQVLYDKAVLGRYLPADDVETVHACFAPQYSLLKGNEEVLRRAAANHADFVLKPQREGGGNLVADEAMRDMLLAPTDELRKAYVLMQRIRPPHIDGVIVRRDQAERGPIVPELGMYGLYIGEAGRALYSECGGYLLRSKLEKHADGGVAAGVACLDAVLLQ